MGNVLPEFDEAGNLKLKKPESEKFYCQYCESEWKTESSKSRHEAWCKDNPNGRTSYRKSTSKPKTKTPKVKNAIIKELKAFDKVFCITDEQIVKYIRGKMK